MIDEELHSKGLAMLEYDIDANAWLFRVGGKSVSIRAGSIKTAEHLYNGHSFKCARIEDVLAS